MLKNRNLYIAGSVVLLLLAGLLLMLSNSDDAEEADPQVTMVNTSEDDPNQTPDEDQPTDENPDTPKTPPLNGNVSEKPIISSSSGITSSQPIPADRAVETSCSTMPSVDCVLEFTNEDSNDLIIFEVKVTDSQGFATWVWTAGEDIPSGTWRSVAKAGDKVSDSEVIYVE